MVKISFSNWPTLLSENAICSIPNSLDSTKSIATLIGFLMKTSMFRIIPNSNIVWPIFVTFSPVADFMWNGSWFIIILVESVVSICKGSKFLTFLYELRDCLFSEKENRSLISSKSMISNFNNGSVVNVTFSVTSHRVEHSLRRNFANFSRRRKLARKLQFNE